MSAEEKGNKFATNPQQIRELILNARIPLVLRDFDTSSWTCFQKTLLDWCRKYDAANDGVTGTFERMSCGDCATPQWERKRQAVKMTAVKFMQEHQDDRDDYWTGLNYKRADELPVACTAGVDFAAFGFPNAANDCSFWLCSKGANTPCHYDTYGCNIVVQVYGRKSWLLFPPETELTATRIPYEESSVYCLENFYAPNIEELSAVAGEAYHCVLEPNMALIVPRHWWHYVEALENSLSINHWIPLIIDIDAQIEECIVKYLIERFLQDASEHDTQYVLNPNQLHQVTSETELLAILEYLLSSASVTDNVSSPTAAKKARGDRWLYHYLDAEQSARLCESQLSLGAYPVSRMTEQAFCELMAARQASRKNVVVDAECSRSPLLKLKELFLNSICSPCVVAKTKREFLKRLRRKTITIDAHP